MQRALLALTLAACGASAKAPDPTPVTRSQPAPAVDAVAPPPPSTPPEAVVDAAAGEKLFAKLGCNACHTVDGSPRVGPTMKAAFGSKVRLADGSEVVFDEMYFRESVLTPAAKLRAGYPPSHPSYEGQVTEAQMQSLLLYVKTLL